MLDEKCLPDGVGLLGLRHRPEFFVGQVELPEALRDEVVVDQQFIDAPKQKLAECRVVKMRMDVVNRRASDDVGDRFAKGGRGMHGVI